MKKMNNNNRLKGMYAQLVAVATMIGITIYGSCSSEEDYVWFKTIRRNTTIRVRRFRNTYNPMMKNNTILIVLLFIIGAVHCKTALGQPIFNGVYVSEALKSSGYMQLSFMNKLNSDVKTPYSPMYFLARDKQTYYFGIRIKQMNTYPPVDTTSCAAAFFKTADGQDVVLKRKSGKSALFAKVDRSWGWELSSRAAPYFDCYIYVFYEIEDFDTFANTLYKDYSLLDGMIDFTFTKSASNKFKKVLLREKEVVDKWYNNPRQANDNPPALLDLNHDYEHPAWNHSEERNLSSMD